VRAAVFGPVVTIRFRGDKIFQGSPDRVPDFIQGRGGSRAPEDLRQGSHRQKEIPPGGMPGSGLAVEGAAGNDVMDVGMVFQSPGIER